MHEAEKLQEAEHRLSQVFDPSQSRDFTYNLRACLGAARSVLQYACKEIEKLTPKPGGKEWFDRWAADPVIAFLKEQRDVDTHHRPVGTDITIRLPSAALISGPDGQDEIFRPEPTTTHRFKGWTGPEDAQTLCRTYLERLAKFIDEGQQNGFLTK